MSTTIESAQEYLAALALFTDAPPEGYVRREGLIFEVGDYPEKRFSLSEAEADRAIANFKPVPGDVEHTPTVLSGNLGVMRSIRREGKAIFGEADVPAWLDTILGNAGSTVSCAWNRGTKLLDGWGWVLEPHVSGAELQRAYANFKREQGAMVNSPLPSSPVRYERPTSPATPAINQPTQKQQRERRFMPLLDFVNKGLNALFNNDTTETPPPVSTTTTTVPTPAPAPVPTPPTTTTTTQTPAPAPVSTPVPAPAPTASFAAPGLPQLEPMDEGTANFRAEQIITRATEQADMLIQGGQLHSSGRNVAIAAFTAAGFDNEQSGPSTVTFSKVDGSFITDRVAMWREVMNHVPQHSLFSSSMPVHIINGSKAANSDDSPEAQGAEQAASFNKEMGATLGALYAASKPSQNGTH